MGDESETGDRGRDERLRAVIADDDPFARRVIKDVLKESGGARHRGGPQWSRGR